MRLSEAIRLGSMTTRQAFGIMFGRDGVSACALGAAAYAIGLTSEHPHTLDIRLYRRFPIVRSITRCPECSDAYSWDSGLGVITHMNDAHRLSREVIADWVALHETIEQPEAVDAVVPVGERVTVCATRAKS
jgi:hypothetical protein